MIVTCFKTRKSSTSPTTTDRNGVDNLTYVLLKHMMEVCDVLQDSNELNFGTDTQNQTVVSDPEQANTTYLCPTFTFTVRIDTQTQGFAH